MHHCKGIPFSPRNSNECLRCPQNSGMSTGPERHSHSLSKINRASELDKIVI